jgi:hypothetical protein
MAVFPSTRIQLITVNQVPAKRASAMDDVHDDRFLVFVRLDPTLVETVPEALEQPVAACSSYGEASRIRRILRGTATGECVIRFIGSAGGGD